MPSTARSPSRAAVRAAALLACWVAALPCPGQGPACRDGDCEPACPVRPGQFGYYATTWRRWPVVDGAADPPAPDPTPAAPPSSMPPRIDEESPRKRYDADPVPAPSPLLPSAGRAALERLVTEADVARLADAAGQRRFTDRLVEALLVEHDPRGRAVLVVLAAGFDTPAAAALCVGALDDPDPLVRSTGCRVCAERRDPAAVAGLARRARDDADLGVRLRAIRALGDLGDAGAVAELVPLLDDPDPAVRSRAVAALVRTTGRDFGADADRWRAWLAEPAAAPRWSLGGALRGLF